MMVTCLFKTRPSVIKLPHLSSCRVLPLNKQTDLTGRSGGDGGKRKTQRKREKKEEQPLESVATGCSTSRSPRLHCVNNLTSHNNNLIKLAQRGLKNAAPSLHFSLSISPFFPYHRLCGAAGISRSCAHREPASCPDTSQPMVFKRRQHCCTAGAPRPIASRVRGASVFSFCLRRVFGTVGRNTAREDWNNDCNYELRPAIMS